MRLRGALRNLTGLSRPTRSMTLLQNTTEAATTAEVQYRFDQLYFRGTVDTVRVPEATRTTASRLPGSGTLTPV